MKIDIVTIPDVCGNRYDASNYPGGDWRCRRNGIKCYNKYEFPVKCPLKDAPPNAEVEPQADNISRDAIALRERVYSIIFNRCGSTDANSITNKIMDSVAQQHPC